MKSKKIMITVIVLAAIAVLAFAGYNIYRYPAAFRSLSDGSLDEAQVNELKDEILAKTDKNILVAYFSYSGTTQRVAVSLSEKTGADLFEIAPQNSYSNVYTQSNREIRRGDKPPLNQTVPNMDDYDIVFVGYPVWWHATPAPVNTFLESYDLTGKLIIPFCTSGESDISETMPTFLDSCDGLAVFGQKRISDTDEIDAWLEELGLDLAAQPDNIESITQNTPEAEEASEVPETTEISKASETTAPSETLDASGKTLVVYYSATGSTKAVANYIADAIGADLFELEPVEPYTDEDLAGSNEESRVSREHNDESLRDVDLVATTVDNFSDYDEILIGYPIWWGIAAWPVNQFIKNNDFTGKTVIPFCTSASSGLGDSGKLLEEMAGTGDWQEGMRFSSNASEEEVQDWVKSLNLN